MPRGGNRPGAGRKRGTPNKASQKRQAEVAASGATPLDVLLRRMRYHDQKAEEELRAGNVSEAERHMREADDAANRAAPYVHPRLQAIQHSGPGGGPIEHKDVSARDVLADRISRIAERSGSA